MRVVIVRLSHLGDVVQTLPLVHALRASVPDLELAWAVEPPFAELVAPLAQVFPFERHGGLKAWPRLARALRTFRPDLALDAQGNLKSAVATRASGAPRRVGFAPADWREPFHRLALTEHAPPAPGPHLVERVWSLARYIAREAVEGFLSKQSWFTKFKDSIEENGFNFVIFVRLVPLFPFNGLNYACGLVPLKLRDYIIGSALGMLPGTFAYVYLGATGCQLIDSVIQGKTSFSQFPDSVKQNLLIAIVLLAVLSLLPIFLKKLRKKKEPSNKA